MLAQTYLYIHYNQFLNYLVHRWQFYEDEDKPGSNGGGIPSGGNPISGGNPWGGGPAMPGIGGIPGGGIPGGAPSGWCRPSGPMGLKGGGIPGGMGPPGGICIGIPCGAPEFGGPIEGSGWGGMNGGAPDTGGIPCGPPGGPDKEKLRNHHINHKCQTKNGGTHIRSHHGGVLMNLELR